MVVEVVSGSRNSLLDGHGLKCAFFMSVLFQDFVIPLNHTRLKRNRIYENPRTIHTHTQSSHIRCRIRAHNRTRLYLTSIQVLGLGLG